MPSDIRVLHSLGVYLPITQNWIYPQITRVPGVASAVLCDDVVNLSQFPLNGRALWTGQLKLPSFIAKGPKPFRVLRRLIDFPVNASALSRARRWKPTLIHAHFGTVGWKTLRLKDAVAVPLITSFYGFDAWELPQINPHWRRRLPQLFARGDLFLVEGPAFRHRLIDLGCAAEKVRVQRLGVDIGHLQYQSPHWTADLKVAMVGRFVEKKGLIDGLSACIQAAASGVSLSVTIIGDELFDAPGGDQIKQQLLALAQSPEVANRVHFKGSVPYQETLGILATHDVFLCPSKHSSSGDAEGGLPVILIEAMALGLLCLGSRHCDIPEAIIDGKTGYLFEEGNVERLANLIQRISRTPELASSITAAGRRHIEEKFSVSRELAALGETYREIANGRFA
jgi:colanic acid/amylovoran biosynthesis glycosyltransferase